jgi:hypothetical protein
VEVERGERRPARDVRHGDGLTEVLLDPGDCRVDPLDVPLHDRASAYLPSRRRFLISLARVET